MPETEKDDLQIYEVGFHILPTIAEADLSAEVVKIRDLVNSLGGAIISEGFPENKNLAYEMTKRIEAKLVRFTRAYFGWVKFELERNKINELEQALKMNPAILRFLVVKTVRENTLYVPKVSVARRSSDNESADAPTVSQLPESESVAPISEEEMDKSIDELVVS